MQPAVRLTTIVDAQIEMLVQRGETASGHESLHNQKSIEWKGAFLE